MGTFTTQVGKLEAANSWWNDASWYFVPLTTNPSEGSEPADIDQARGFYAQYQVIPGSGFSGLVGPITFPSLVWNGTSEKYEMPRAAESVTMSGRTLEFSAYAVVRNHQGISPQSCTVSGDTISATGHGLSNDDHVVIISDGGSLPTGYTAGLVVKVSGATANTFDVVNLDDSAVGMSSAGSALYVTPVRGSWHIYEDFAEAQVVPDGGSQEFATQGESSVTVQGV